MNAYVVGQPGAGKTTLMRALTADLAHVTGRLPFAHTIYVVNRRSTGVQLGADHATFGGTDRLSMSVGPKAIGWVRKMAVDHPEIAVVGEGDRLAYKGFLDALDGTLVWIDVPDEVAAERRAARGSEQNETWLAGRRSKVRKLVQAHPCVVRLDGTLPTQEQVAMALRLVPAFRQLRGEA